MKKYFTITLFCLSVVSQAQNRQKELSFTITNNHTAYPFSSFSKLFAGVVHPGVEVGYHFNWKTRPRHDWFQTFKAGYFYHRFVQHGIPVYTQFGYRYKFSEHLQASSSLGVGYMHSIPATAVLERNEQGEYENGKGIGRGQAIINLTFGAHYKMALQNKRPITLSLQYQQRLQTPFVKSYVPLLPYNSMQLCVSLPLHHKLK